MPTYKELLKIGKRVPLMETSDYANHSVTFQKLGRDVLDIFASRDVVMTMIKAYNSDNTAEMYRAFESLYDKIKVLILNNSTITIDGKGVKEYIDAAIEQKIGSLNAAVRILQEQIDMKQDLLIAGDGIQIQGSIISVGNTEGDKDVTYGQWEDKIEYGALLVQTVAPGISAGTTDFPLTLKCSYIKYRVRDIFVNGTKVSQERTGDTPYDNVPYEGFVEVSVSTGGGYTGKIYGGKIPLVITENVSPEARNVDIIVQAGGLTVSKTIVQYGREDTGGGDIEDPDEPGDTPGGEPDDAPIRMYVGQVDGSKTQFADLSVDVLKDNSEALSVQSVTRTVTKTIFYVMLPTGKTFGKITYVDGGITSNVTEADLNCTHDDVVINGDTYKVYAYRVFPAKGLNYSLTIS